MLVPAEFELETRETFRIKLHDWVETVSRCAENIESRAKPRQRSDREVLWALARFGLTSNDASLMMKRHRKEYYNVLTP